MGDPVQKYLRAADAVAGTAAHLFDRLSAGSKLLHADVLQLVVAALPTIAGEILADPEIMEPEEEVP